MSLTTKPNLGLLTLYNFRWYYFCVTLLCLVFHVHLCFSVCFFISSIIYAGAAIFTRDSML